MSDAVSVIASEAKQSRIVGWVERSETHHSTVAAMGFTSFNPSYKTNPLYEVRTQ